MIRKKKKNWEKFESDIAEELYGKIVFASGRLPCDKGDIRVDTENLKFLVECKSTEKEGFRVSKPLWDKIKSQAYAVGRIPLIALKIGTESFIVCESSLFADLLEKEE